MITNSGERMTTQRHGDLNGTRPRTRARATLGVAAVAAALLATGCSSSGGGGVTTKATLKSVALSTADAGSGLSETVTVKLAQDGTSVGSDQPTLQACSAPLPSEKLRKQRLQQDYYDQPRRISASDEVVRYKSGGATKAYDEEKAALKNCSSTTDETKHIPTSGLEKELVATTTKVLNGDGSLVYSAAIYQWRDDLLDAVYVYRGSTTEALGLAVTLAKAAAKNLNAAK